MVHLKLKGNRHLIFLFHFANAILALTTKAYGLVELQLHSVLQMVVNFNLI